MHFDLEKFEFDEEWLRQAVRLEDEADCDIEAGFNWGSDISNYIANRKSLINHNRLMSILQEELGNLLDQEDLEAIANSFQDQVRDRVIEKLQSAKSA